MTIAITPEQTQRDAAIFADAVQSHIRGGLSVEESAERLSLIFGEERAAQIVASSLRGIARDGRLSPANIAWANRRPADPDIACGRVRVEIHPAHLNQLACAFRDRARKKKN